MQHSADGRREGRGRAAREILRNARELAKLGDAIVNFVVSASLTLYKRRPVGVKVSNRVLGEGWRRSSLAEIAKRPTDLTSGDLAEAAIAYAWLAGLLSIDDMIRELLKSLEEEGEERGLVLGLRRILDSLARTSSARTST